MYQKGDVVMAIVDITDEHIFGDFLSAEYIYKAGTYGVVTKVKAIGNIQVSFNSHDLSWSFNPSDDLFIKVGHLEYSE